MKKCTFWSIEGLSAYAPDAIYCEYLITIVSKVIPESSFTSFIYVSDLTWIQSIKSCQKLMITRRYHILGAQYFLKIEWNLLTMKCVRAERESSKILTFYTLKTAVYFFFSLWKLKRGRAWCAPCWIRHWGTFKSTLINAHDHHCNTKCMRSVLDRSWDYFANIVVSQNTDMAPSNFCNLFFPVPIVWRRLWKGGCAGVTWGVTS